MGVSRYVRRLSRFATLKTRIVMEFFRSENWHPFSYAAITIAIAILLSGGPYALITKNEGPFMLGYEESLNEWATVSLLYICCFVGTIMIYDSFFFYDDRGKLLTMYTLGMGFLLVGALTIYTFSFWKVRP